MVGRSNNSWWFVIMVTSMALYRTGTATSTTHRRRLSDSFSRLYSGAAGRFEGFRYQQPDTKRGAYAEAAASEILMPCIILVNPFLDQNVGSVSRAMLNFGLHELRVVNPRCDILSESARALAAGSVEILENAKLFPTIEECVADLQRVFATTVRPRYMTQSIFTPTAAAQAALSQSNDVKVGIMFGRERNGLTNEEVALSDSIISIPSFKHFSSLNLAQAVNIVGFELWKRNLDLCEQMPPNVWLNPKDGQRLTRRAELDFFLGRVESALDERNFQKNPDIRDANYRNIRSIFQRTLMTRGEVELMHGVLTTLVKKPDSSGGSNSKDDESIA